MSKKLLTYIIMVALTLSAVLPLKQASAANQQLVVDLAVNTGALKYSAAGTLYGLGDEGIPTDTMLAPLRLQTAAQKAPDGLQHPNGDALKVAPMFVRNGGKRMEIYMQDIYQNWPYENLGLQDYLNKITVMVPKIVNDPNYGIYTYVPFNEPNGNWYPKILEYGTTAGSQDRAKFFEDWKTVYNHIRSLDPQAKIAGPALTHYHGQFHTDFMTYAKNNNVIPDYFVWHELQNSFFSNWYSNVSHYRNIEASLGISPRPISINEYARSSGDLGVPGNLVQFMARFENSKVEAMLAYWTPAGSMNDLVTENNKATGAWWLYKWYGELTGHTVAVTPPTQNGSLQGLAALDSSKKQARVIFGGSLYSSDVFATDVVVKGFGSASYFGSSVHVSVWETDNTGTNPSSGPVLKLEGDYSITNGQIIVPVTGMKALSAYHMIITPNKDLSAVNNPNRYEAEYANLAGTAAVTYGSNSGYSGTYFSEGYVNSSNASTQFYVTAANNGYYDITLRYSAGPISGAPANRTIRIKLNGANLKDVTLPGTADWNTWASATERVYLTAGINRIDVNAYTTDNSDAIQVDYIEIAPRTGQVTVYEAEATGNTLGGAAVVANDSAASNGKLVGFIGAGSANFLQFNNVNVPTSGVYRMVVTHANAEYVGSSGNIVDRYAEISVNGGNTQKVYFRNTFSWSTFKTAVVTVNLNAGNNTIKFSNSSTGYAPNIDKIEIAAAIGQAVPSSGSTYKIIARHSGKPLGIASNSTANGANVVQQSNNTNNSTNQFQKWVITDLGNGYYQITNVGSSKSLDINQGSTSNGASAIQWTYQGGTNQQWQIVDLGNGYYKIVARHSLKVLDINQASTADGGQAIQWTDQGGTNQQWQLVLQ